MTLEQWQNNGWLRPHATSREEIGNLLSIARRDLSDARSREISDDWRFGIAWAARDGRADVGKNVNNTGKVAMRLRMDLCAAQDKGAKRPSIRQPALYVSRLLPQLRQQARMAGAARASHVRDAS